MRMLIGADVVPTDSNLSAFINMEIESIIGKEMKKLIDDSDFCVLNLETPLADKSAPIKKCGPNLIAPTACVNGIKAIGVSAFTLANNHIMDHGVQGLESTMKALSENEIDFFGAGKKLGDAQRPYIIEKDGIRVGIYACAEHEFSIADENKPGANPFNPLESLDHIEALKKQCDYVIVLYHGGKEYYRYPSPQLQKVCRKMCDKGADVVICQHSHCIGCEEKYNYSTIIYGQGNFIFDAGDDEFWNSALLVELNFEPELKVNYIPLEKENGIMKLSDNESILNDFEKRSEEIKEPGFVTKKYKEFAERMCQNYILAFSGNNIFFKVINKLFRHRLKKSISEKKILAMQNYIECEAHRELVLAGFKMANKIH